MNRTLFTVAAAFALAGCGAPAKVIHVPDGPLADAGNILATSPPPAPKGPADVFGNGTHKVIDEIQVGTYRTGGSTITDIPVCSWKLFAGDRTIASGSASGPVSIVVLPEYTAVQSTNCLEWVRQP